MPSDDRERQRRHRRQRADDEGGAHALQRLVEHVVAGAVGAEHVVAAAPARSPAPASRQTTAKVSQRGAHRDVGAVGGDVAQRAARAAVRAAHQAGGEQHRERRRPPARRRGRRSTCAATSPAHCASGIASGARRRTAGAAKSRTAWPSRSHRLLGEGRCRPAAASRWSRAIAIWPRQHQRRAATRCVGVVERGRARRGAGRGRQRAPEVHAVEQRHDQRTAASTIAGAERRPGRAAPCPRWRAGWRCAARARRTRRAASSSAQSTTSVQSKTNLRHADVGVRRAGPAGRPRCRRCRSAM